MPFIEVLNRDEICEAGFRYKDEILKLKAEIQGLKVGTLLGDRNIEEAENDE